MSFELFIFATYVKKTMNKEKLTEDKAKQSPSGGVVVGKRNGQTMIYDDASVGGYFVGKTHAEGGIKMINKSTGQPLEVQGAEVIITAPAVADQTKREFEGRMMTNREILSEINKRGGGVSFADGGNIPTEMHFSGNSYKYGGKTVSDHDIAYEISKCGCEHGGHLSKGMSLKQIAKMHGVTLLELNRQVKMGLDAESEHTPKVTEQMKIVKDHLYENPNYYSLLKKAGLKKGGEVDYVTYKDKYNKKYNYDKNTSHDLEVISKDTGISVKGLQQIYNKGIGAYKTNPSSVRPNVKSKEQWAMARVYSAVMGGKASEVDSKELKMNHGGKVEYSLVKDAKSGNSPSRDLNNYNDLMDIQADNAVGGDIGVYANGGALGASGLPLVDYVEIIDGGTHLRPLKTNDKYYNFESLKKRVAEEYKLLPTSPMYRGYITVQAYDTEGEKLVNASSYISNMKNTVKNFNPYTGNASNLEKSLSNSRPVSFKKYDWSGWLSGKKSMPTKQASATSNLVTGIYISYTNPTNNSLSSFTVDNASEFLYTLLNLYRNSITKIDYRIIVNGNILEETISDLKLNDDVTDNWRLNPNTINPKVATLDDVAYRLEKENSFFDFTNFMKSGGVNSIGQPTSSTIAQPSATQSSKFTSAEIKLFKAIDDIVLEDSLRNVEIPILEWNSSGAKDYELVNEDTGEVFKLRSYGAVLGLQNGDINLKKSLALLKDYIDWKGGQSTSTTSTSTAQTSSSKFTKGENEMFQQVYDYVTKNDLTVMDTPLVATPSTEFVPFIDKESNTTYFPLRFEYKLTKVLAFEEGNKMSQNFIIKYLEWLKEKQSGSSTATTAQPSSSKYPTINYPIQLEQTKIWIGDNTELSKRVQQRAMELGWDWWSGDKQPRNLEMQSLFFDDSNKITGTDTRQSFEGFKDYKEIFESDLFGSATTATQTQPTAPLTEEQKIASEFVADDSVLRRNDILGSSSLQQERNDLDALTKLLPSFQQSKFSNEKSSILKEMARIQKKLDYKGFIASNEEVSKGKDLFTPQGLLNYYFTQATQNPTAELQPPCELPTPNGGKSKLPLVAYLNVRSSQFKKWFGDWEKAYETNNYVNCSKMIDEETKEPKIFYHGVRKYIPSFGQMSNMGVGVVRPYGAFEPPNFPASYFADNESYANFYGGIAENMPKPSEEYKPFIYKVFLCIKNPISLLPLDFEISYKDLIDYVLVAYGIRLNVNSVLLKQLGEDMNKKHPVWVYIRRDIGLIEMLKDKGYDALIQQGDIPVFDKNGEVVSDRSKFIKDTEYLSFYPNQVKSATVKKSFYFNFFNDIRFKKGGYVRI